MILPCVLWADVLAYDNILTFTHNMYMQLKCPTSQAACSPFHMSHSGGRGFIGMMASNMYIQWPLYSQCP